MIHQGTRLIPCDFIAFGLTLNHDILLANLFAQAEALAFGKTAEQVQAEGIRDWLLPHRVFKGNRPSKTILAERLTRKPSVSSSPLRAQCFYAGHDLGHRLVRPVGLELGRRMAQRIIPELESKEEPALAHDSSTNLIYHYRQLKEAL